MNSAVKYSRKSCSPTSTHQFERRFSVRDIGFYSSRSHGDRGYIILLLVTVARFLVRRGRCHEFMLLSVKRRREIGIRVPTGTQGRATDCGHYISPSEVIMHKHFLSTVFVSLGLSACSFAPNFERPQVSVPEGWSTSPHIAASSHQHTSLFWEDLGSES